MKIIFSSKPKIGADETIATASNGRVYVEGGELHVHDDARHIAFKRSLVKSGWFRIDGETLVYLGANCAPTALFENLVVEDEQAWADVIVVPEEKRRKD